MVVLENYEDKVEIFKNRNVLKGTKIYINDDCTKKERRRQQEIKKTAAAAIKEGKKVVIKYKKLIIDDAVWAWNERDMKLFRKE